MNRLISPYLRSELSRYYRFGLELRLTKQKKKVIIYIRPETATLDRAGFNIFDKHIRTPFAVILQKKKLIL